MLFSERGLDLSTSAIMFEHLSLEAQHMALNYMNAHSQYELNWDVIPMAQLPYGVISDFDQSDIDLQALTQIGYYRLAQRL